jgi:hypothetical protein
MGGEAVGDMHPSGGQWMKAVGRRRVCGHRVALAYVQEV